MFNQAIVANFDGSTALSRTAETESGIQRLIAFFGETFTASVAARDSYLDHVAEYRRLQEEARGNL